YTRSLRSPAAMPRIPSSPKWRRTGRVLPAQSSESSREILETSEEAEKNPIHLAGDDPRKCAAHPRELSGSLHTHPSEMSPGGRNSGVPLLRTGTMRLVRWRGEYGGPTSRRYSSHH